MNGSGSMGRADKPQPVGKTTAKRKLSAVTDDSPLTDVGDEHDGGDREDVFEGLDEAAYDDD